MINSTAFGLILWKKLWNTAAPKGVRVLPIKKQFSVKKYKNAAYMQNRLTNSLRYLANAKPGTNHSTNPTNPNGNSKQ